MSGVDAYGTRVLGTLDRGDRGYTRSARRAEERLNIFEWGARSSASSSSFERRVKACVEAGEDGGGKERRC